MMVDSKAGQLKGHSDCLLCLTFDCSLRRISTVTAAVSESFSSHNGLAQLPPDHPVTGHI